MTEEAPGIHQFVPVLHRHDAVGEHAREVRRLLRAAGHRAEIYTELSDPGTEAETRPYRDYEAEAVPGDVLVYQFATASGIAAWLAGRSEPLVLNYHSVTPARHFARWNGGVARLQETCVAELSALAPAAALGVAVSEFDRVELAAAGCRKVVVIPVSTAGGAPSPPDAAMADRLGTWRGDGPLWLAVGRLAPNKAVEDVLCALFVSRQALGVDARLVVVGAPSESHYAEALRRFVHLLGLGDEVAFCSGLSDGELAACYATADVLVSLSEHEGFGVPLVEAMRAGLPVVAYAAGAVAETVGGAAVLLDDKAPRRVADAVSTLLSDEARRKALVDAGRERVEALGMSGAGERLVDLLVGLAGSQEHPERSGS